MRRAFLFGGLAIAAAVIFVMGSVTYVLFNIDDLVKENIVSTGTRAFKVPVSVADATVSLKTGNGEIVGLRIGSPPGFQAEASIHAPLIQLSVDSNRPAGKSIILSRLVIERPRIMLEIVNGEANLARLRQSTLAWARRSEDAQSPASTGQRLSIDQVTIQNGTLVLIADFLGDKTVEAPLPDTRFKGIGADDGALPAEVAVALTELIVTAAERASRRFDLDTLAADAGSDAPEINLKKMLTE